MTRRTPRRLLALLAAALVGAAAGQVAPGPADAASGYCASGTGVTVVVDYGSLGRGTSVGCDPRGARVTGSTVVPRAGFPLTYVARQPGFVCRVSGLPTPTRESCGNTPPQNAYWGLFSSDGTSGRWTYASVGIGSLRVPAGGFIGWRFEGGTRTVPRLSPVSPRPASPKPRPRPKPTPKPTPTPRPTHRPRPTPPTHHATPRPTHHATHHASQPTPAGQQATHHASATPAPSGRSAATRAAPSSKPGTATSPKAPGRSPSTTPAPATTVAPSSGRSATSQPSAAAAAAGSPSGSTSPAASTTDADLQSGEQATGSPAALPVLAGGLAVVLLGSAGVVAYRRRRS
ncbi:MAG: hypothetical protein QOF53_3927 [Nocardioidaceae bacterium]|nr:hypothetical protein [Nocardioidaceae bacterium]